MSRMLVLRIAGDQHRRSTKARKEGQLRTNLSAITYLGTRAPLALHQEAGPYIAGPYILGYIGKLGERVGNFTGSPRAPKTVTF